jgi:hypothetical protein
MTTLRTHFTFRVDMWTPDGTSRAARSYTAVVSTFIRREAGGVEGSHDGLH